MRFDFRKYRKALILFVKLSLGVLAIWIIFSMINQRAGNDWKNFLGLWKGPKTDFLLLAVGLMSLFNLLLEVGKWQFLVKKVEPIGFGKAIQSILAGWNLALFTPARLGEFGGRILFLNQENRKKGALCILVGNLSQLLVTLFLGLFSAFLWFKLFFKPHSPWLWGLGFLALLLGIFMVAIYFSLNRSHGLWSRIPFLKSQLSSLEVLRDFSNQELFISLIFSLARYTLFTHQYIFLLYGLLGYHNYFMCLESMGLIFMVQSIVPSFVLSDMGIRGANAVFFLSFVFGKQNLIPILATAFYVWLVNIILPALIGLFFVLKIKSSFGRP